LSPEDFASREEFIRTAIASFDVQIDRLHKREKKVREKGKKLNAIEKDLEEREKKMKKFFEKLSPFDKSRLLYDSDEESKKK